MPWRLPLMWSKNDFSDFARDAKPLQAGRDGSIFDRNSVKTASQLARLTFLKGSNPVRVVREVHENLSPIGKYSLARASRIGWVGPLRLIYRVCFSWTSWTTRT